MWKPSLLAAPLLVSACVTVNIYFPAAAVERAADQIVKETWGGPGESPQKGQPPGERPAGPSSKIPFAGVSEAYAQEPDINISNPAIRALKDSIRKRSDAIKPFMDRGAIGINQDGLLAVRSTDGLSLKDRAEAQQLVEAENRDREALYMEIAKANNFPQNTVPKIKRIFAKSWIDQAKPGWWIQEPQGSWKKK